MCDFLTSNFASNNFYESVKAEKTENFPVPFISPSFQYFNFQRLKNNRVAPLAGENLDGYDWDYDDDQTLFYSLPPTSAYNHQTNQLRPDERDYPPAPDPYHDHERGQIRRKKMSCDDICDYFITHSQKIIAFV